MIIEIGVNMICVLLLTGLGFNVIGSLVLINSNRELINAIIKSFKNIESNMNIGSMGEDEWFPKGWEYGFNVVVKKNTKTNRFAFISLTVGFSMQFIASALGVL